MKTFVLAIFVASAAIGVESYDCSPQIMDFVVAMRGCSSECGRGTDDCITCVMDKMGFGTDTKDTEAFVKAEAHIMGDPHSLDCLDSMSLIDVPMTEESFKDFIAPLKGKSLAEVNTVKADQDLLRVLFEAANTCIAEGGCFVYEDEDEDLA